MSDHYWENDLIERTGLTKKEVRDFRNTELTKGDDYIMEKHRYRWTSSAALRLLHKHRLDVTLVNPSDNGKTAPDDDQRAALKQLERVDESVIMEVFRNTSNGLRNDSVVEAVPPGINGWLDRSKVKVVKVGQGNSIRWKPGSKMRVEPVPGRDWLYRLTRRRV